MGVLGAGKKDRIPEIDIRAYAKYLLREGALAEKREMLASMKSSLLLRDRVITIRTTKTGGDL